MDIDWNVFIDKMFKTIPQLNSVDANMVMTSAHDIEYQIHNHLTDRQKRPLSSVGFHPCEDPNDGSLLETMMRLYIVKNIREVYGMSLTDYLDMPMDVIDMMNKLADQENKSKANAVGNIEEEFKKI